MTLTTTTEGRWRVDLRPDHEAAVEFRSFTMAQTFMDLIDAGQEPMRALRNVIELRQENQQTK
jgi:hypothetical protein